jgi:hypothetical protein
MADQTTQMQEQTNCIERAQQEEDLETKYINQLNPMETIVLKIAKEHLQTSFDLKKSIGYKNWLKNLSGA